MNSTGKVAKFFAALITGLVGWATAVVNSADSGVTDQEWIMLATIVSAAILVFIVPNSGTTTQ